MGDLKLKNNIGLGYDEEKYAFTFQNIDNTKGKKVTSRAFPSLLGMNKYESVGKTVLERFGLIEKETIDPYYMLRGELAEYLVYQFIENTYKVEKKVENFTLMTWNKYDIGFDNFSKNEKFGGMIDIAITKPEEFRAVIEVKSKSMKDLEMIKEKKGNEEEVYQGLFLSYLSKVNKCLMAYVFFTPEQESAIKGFMALESSAKKSVKDLCVDLGMKFQDFKIVMFKYSVSDYDMPTLTNVAWQALELFKNKMSIESTYFSTKEIQYLQSIIGGGEDLPF